MRRGLVRFAAAAATLSSAWQVAPAWADALGDAATKLVDLEGRIRELAANFRDDAAAPVTYQAERRLIDAETLLELKQYGDAATLLLDIVEKYPSTRVYDDAIVLLGEALYQERDYLAARRYFARAVEKRSGSRREQQALQRLVEIALRNDDFEGVDDYLARLSSVPAGQLEPSVPYVRGKYFYLRDRLDDALVAFGQVMPENPFYLKARYFIATAYVQRGDLAAAATGFDLVLRAQPRDDSDQEVQALARMALGRIHYERSQFDDAKKMYVSVDRRSPHFSDALYETAWTSIKASDFLSAHRAIELMLLENPDTPRGPELKLLLGNLSLRLEKFHDARLTFDQNRAQFEPVYEELRGRLDKAKSDPAYIQTLLGANLDKFDIAIFLPPEAARYVQNEPDVQRVLTLAGDVGEIRQAITDSELLLERLDRAVEGTGKVAIFADLAARREESSEILNQSFDVRRRFAAEARKLAEGALSADDRRALDAHAAERQRLEESLRDLPMTAEALRQRDSGARKELQALEDQGSEINVLVHSLEAELVAIEQYDRTTRAAGGQLPIGPEEIRAQAEQLREAIAELHRENDALRAQIADARRQNSAAGAAGEGERSAVKRLSSLMTQEYDLYRRARGGLSGDAAREFDRISAIIDRADSVAAQVQTFDERVDRAAEARLVQIREMVEAERGNLKAATAQLAALTTESQGVGGGLAQTVLGRVTDRFYELVVQSDVGIIDVAWGLKDEKTQIVNRLVNEQKAQMQALTEDFRDILEEGEQ